MEVERPPAQSTLVVILGASIWPDYDDFNSDKSETFANSVSDLREYFLQKFYLPEKNLKNLFDADLSSDDIDRAIGEFLEKRIQEMEAEGNDAKNLLFYFVGHGISDINDFYLAIRRTRKKNTSSSGLRIVSLSRTLKEHARFLRCFLIFDCCFAAAAAKYLQGPEEEVVIEKLSEPFKIYDSDVAEITKGVTLLCSSSHKDASISVSDDGRHTMFSGALLHVLNKGDTRRQDDCMSLRTITNLVKEYLSDAYKGEAPKPQVNSPDQSEGDIADFPLFPNLAKKVEENIRHPIEKFAVIKETAQCCVVVSETEEKVQLDGEVVFETGEKIRRGETFGSVVKRMLRGYRASIQKSTGLSCLRDPYIISASNAISSKEWYENAIDALCNSSIAVFDVTNFEPAVMLLLGIRSVVRRGVTILSSGSDISLQAHFEVPFNVKEVSIVSHAEDRYKDPMFSIGDRIVEGLDQLRLFPHYLDLPSFDAIRTIPTDPESQRSKNYTEQVLILCPFGKYYSDNNWEKHIKRNLGVYIQDVADTAKQPDLIRTLDTKSPRLVSQKLYEMIRFTSMCLVDWTLWRPNVFFELGVRLAANETGPVYIIEDQHKAVVQKASSPRDDFTDMERPAGVSVDDMTRLALAHSQCIQLLRLFAPIEYKALPGDGDIQAYERMVSYYREVIQYTNDERSDWEKGKEWEEKWGSLPPDFTYKAVSRMIDLDVELATKAAYNELIESATLLSGFEGVSSRVLYKNKELRKKASEGADERLLAAWYYLNQRYELKTIALDSELVQKYESLGNQLSTTLITSSNSADVELASQIRRQVKKFRELMKEFSNENANR